SNTPEQTIVYSVPGTFDANITIEATHHSGTQIGQTLYTEKHYFIGNPLNELSNFVAMAYSPALDGRETQTDEMVQDGQIPVRSSQRKWDQQSPTPLSGSYIAGYPLPPYNPRITQTVTTVDGVTG